MIWRFLSRVYLNGTVGIRLKREACRNPWKKKPCQNTNIIVSITYKGEMLPICRECWVSIAKPIYKVLLKPEEAETKGLLKVEAEK